MVPAVHSLSHWKKMTVILVCVLLAVQQKGRGGEMDSNITQTVAHKHTHKNTECQRGSSVYDRLGLRAGLVELLS